jgi:hypothetical protein
MPALPPAKPGKHILNESAFFIYKKDNIQLYNSKGETGGGEVRH